MIKPPPHLTVPSPGTKIICTTTSWSQPASGGPDEIFLNDRPGITPKEHTVLLLPCHPTMMWSESASTTLGDPWDTPDFTVPVLFCCATCCWVARSLPPGPKGLAVLGNSHQIPVLKYSSVTGSKVTWSISAFEANQH
jgi:hypothetical protein